ncbi:MAG: hypothetical protein PF517_09885, partial [Salinivirgaceae bacterium]|nr:hypothetical protein [Salinivirgaceae bacterium]
MSGSSVLVDSSESLIESFSQAVNKTANPSKKELSAHLNITSNYKDYKYHVICFYWNTSLVITIRLSNTLNN